MRLVVRVALLAILGLTIGSSVSGFSTATADTMASNPTSPVPGFTLHIDAPNHFPGNPDAVAHHWCRPAEAGLTECLLFTSDAANANMVGVEVIVPTATWKTFSAAEQAQWHYHRAAFAKLSPTLPGLSKAEADRVLAGMAETYGKIYLLWDPTTSNSPTGQPFVSVLKPHP